MPKVTTAILNGKLIIDDTIVENKILLFNEKIIDIVEDKSLMQKGLM